MGKSVFRYDINGLRALAVCAVVLFHFRVPGFSGGFVGVDVFFVISGFLMTSIIVRGLEGGHRSFKLFDFYIARARRIIPALLFLCTFLLVVGWFLLAPHDYVKLAREVDRALLFISNNYYYKNSGYFEANAHERLLLHTWSLSVEWQFYMLYPLFLMLIAKLGLRWLPYWIAALLVASFGVSAYTSVSDPTYAFYLLPSRAWEMLAGGVVFYIARSSVLQARRKLFYYSGVLFIVLAAALYDQTTLWPSFPALLPVFGAMFVIFANCESWSNKNLLAQRLGDWSYSIYLWHWPLVVALVFLESYVFSYWFFGLIALSVFLGWLSYRFIENPSRRFLSTITGWKVLLVILFAMALLLIPAEKIRKAKGYMSRISNDIYELLNYEFDRFAEMDKCHENRRNSGVDCAYGVGESTSAIVMGDSHAMSLMPALVDFYSARGGRVLDWTVAGCPTILDVKFFNDSRKVCVSLLKEKFSILNQFEGVPVILSNRYSAYLLGSNALNASKTPWLYINNIYSEFNEDYTAEVFAGYKNSICEIAKTNPVYMFSPVPELRVHVPKSMGRALMYRGLQTRVSITHKEFQQRNAIANKMLKDLEDECGVKILDLEAYFCDEEKCYGDREGTPVYFDEDHLNVTGARLLNDLLEIELNID